MNAGFCDEVLSGIFKRFLASLFPEVTLSPIPLHVVKGCQSSAAQTDGVAPLDVMQKHPVLAALGHPSLSQRGEILRMKA